MQLLKSLEVRLRALRNQITPLIYRGDAVYCPVCEKSFSKFLPAGTGDRHRTGAVCPYCRSRERDRLTWLFLHPRADSLLPPASGALDFLHIAPEPRLGKWFRARCGRGYLSADLMRKDVDVKMDVTDIPYADAHFDAVYCSHVYQDVPDEPKALAETFRVLRPGGWGILNVPISVDVTRENNTPGNVRAAWDKRPDEHVRSYGPDYTERLTAAGFTVEAHTPEDLAPDTAQRTRMSLAHPSTGFVHFVRKPV